MQTFLPYRNFIQTAKCLDYKRLGKQRVEAYQILRVLLGESDGWKNHPAVKMWDGYHACLFLYAEIICQEWIDRGYKDTMLLKLRKLGNKHCELNWNLRSPNWLRDKRIIETHRSNLLRKDKEYYSKFNWDVDDNLSYYWPI